VTALITAFKPAQSPPLVKIAIFFTTGRLYTIIIFLLIYFHG